MLWPSQMVLMVKNPSLGGDHPEEEEMATHSSTLSVENSRDRGAWRATVHGIAKSLT